MVPVHCDSYHNNGAFARICLYYYCISGKFGSELKLAVWWKQKIAHISDCQP